MSSNIMAKMISCCCKKKVLRFPYKCPLKPGRGAHNVLFCSNTFFQNFILLNMLYMIAR